MPLLYQHFVFHGTTTAAIIHFLQQTLLYYHVLILYFHYHIAVLSFRVKLMMHIQWDVLNQRKWLFLILFCFYWFQILCKYLISLIPRWLLRHRGVSAGHKCIKRVILRSSRGLFTPMFQSTGGRAVQQPCSSHQPSEVPPSWFLPSKFWKRNRLVCFV